MADLKDDLQDISGIGPATADAILDILDDHELNAEEDPKLGRAIAEAQARNDREAAVWLRRYAGQ